MKHFFVVVLVVHTADGVIVIVWIIRAPRRKAGGFVLPLASVLDRFVAWQVFFVE